MTTRAWLLTVAVELDARLTPKDLVWGHGYALKAFSETTDAAPVRPATQTILPAGVDSMKGMGDASD